MEASSPSYDPRVWGGDYTETNGWNFAFHAPQDGQGLANLYGGRDGARGEARHVLRHAGDGDAPGGYGGIIHEMLEARDVRMGQLGHEQPARRTTSRTCTTTPAQPSKTQEKVREILRRLYVGSEIGQGYPGDEDNGEMSAWYVFSALGHLPAAGRVVQLRDRLAAVHAG